MTGIAGLHNQVLNPQFYPAAKPKMFMIISSSIGNYSLEEIEVLLNELSSVMTEEDRSIVGRLHIDVPLLLGLMALAAIGLVALYSAGGESTRLMTRQAVRLGIAFTVMDRAESGATSSAISSS